MAPSNRRCSSIPPVSGDANTLFLQQNLLSEGTDFKYKRRSGRGTKRFGFKDTYDDLVPLLTSSLFIPPTLDVYMYDKGFQHSVGEEYTATKRSTDSIVLL
ncbi:hypothetical protein T10_9627 [Trichinella papuae]|uniref:Uncharacterized protein n=1 Tax=Trichinella papuae TaxID=268474 RepID=A0A0V1MNB7_9BILA|nr:hypothetical protein T10_9975 [Trichinella papuae]KRZ73321.1 hypothetical protein T10_9627 [Trichinella papuae]